MVCLIMGLEVEVELVSLKEEGSDEVCNLFLLAVHGSKN